MKNKKLSYLVIVMIALVAVMIIGCAPHRYEMRYGINQEGGYVASYGRPDANDSRVLWNEKAWSDSFWQAQARKLRIEAVNESLLAAAYCNGSSGGAGELQLGVVINATGHDIQIRGRRKVICPRQVDSLFLRPGSQRVIIDHLDSQKKLMYTRSMDFLVDGIRQNAMITGLGVYDWTLEIAP